MKNFIIAKYLDGRMVRGHTLDIGNKESFHLETEQGEHLTVTIADLKAVFFLKTEKQIGKKNPMRAGSKVSVKFHDGEEIIGVSFDFNLKKDRFFLFPLEDKDSNERILVNRRATKSVTNLGAAFNATQHAEREKLRRRLEHEVYKCLYQLAEQMRNPSLELDETLVTTHCVLLKKKMMPMRQQYEHDFGRDAWLNLVDHKLMEIEMSLGAQVRQSMQRIIDKVA